MSELALHLINKARRAHSPLLDLGRCGLQGLIPAEITEQLTELTWLKTLILSNAWFEFDDNRGGFVQRKSVNAGTPNTLDSLPEVLSRLTNLKKLVCSGQAGENWNIRSLQPLAGLNELETLYCDRNRIFDLRPLANMPNLRHLSCRKNDLEDLSPLSGLSRLRVLSIGQNQVSDLSALRSLRDLAVLSLPKNRVRDLGPLSGMQALQWLDCAENNIRDWSPLADLGGLAVLEHSGNDSPYPEPAPMPYGPLPPATMVEEPAKTYSPGTKAPPESGATNQPTAQKKTIFISYARKNKKYLDELKSHLAALETSGLAVVWDDEKIVPGSTRQQEKTDQIRAADVILLLVSADFLSSDEIASVEVSLALELHDSGKAVVIPLILDDCLWTLASFGRLDPLPADGRPIMSMTKRARAWREIAEKIAGLIVPP